MTRATSIDSYNEIRDSGLLSQRRWEVYDVLFRSGPMTASEVFREISINNGKGLGAVLGLSNNTRFTELRNLGVVFEAGERVCRVSGRNVIEWAVTGDLPIKKQRIQKPRSVFVLLDLFGEVRECRSSPFPGAIEFRERKVGISG